MRIKYQFLTPQMIDNHNNQDILILDHKDVDKKAAVYFITKFPDKQKEALLKECSAVLYTPENEHFGIVPIEAMLAMRPPIACRSGGPLETIVDGETGFLCESNEEEWAKAMKKFVDDRQLTLKLGRAGKQRVIKNFSRKQLEHVMDKVVKDVMDKKFNLSLSLKIQTCLISGFILFSFTILAPILYVMTNS